MPKHSAVAIPPYLELQAGGLRFLIVVAGSDWLISCLELKEHGRGQSRDIAILSLFGRLIQRVEKRKFPRWVRKKHPLLYDRKTDLEWLELARDEFEAALRANFEAPDSALRSMTNDYRAYVQAVRDELRSTDDTKEEAT